MKTAMAIRLTDEPESKSAKAYDGSDKTQESTAPIRRQQRNALHRETRDGKKTAYSRC